MESIGVHLQPYIDKGLLRFEASRPTVFGLEMHLTTMHRAIETFKPGVVIVDPITNLVSAGSHNEVQSMLTRLIDYLKMEHITALITTLTKGGSSTEQTEVGISSLMDTWMVLTDIESGGERNRGLMILKSRGMAHSNQIREFLLTDQGIRLEDVYLGPAGVLTGSARAAQESKERMAEAGMKDDFDRKRRELEAQATRRGSADRRPTGGHGSRRGGDEEDRSAGADEGERAERAAGGYGSPPWGGRGGPCVTSAGKAGRMEKRSESAAKAWELRLYVAGRSDKATRAFENLKAICEEHLEGKYHIEVIDLLEKPQLARGDQIIAIPTLVRKLPEPLRKLIGDLSNTERVLVGLDVKAAPKQK